MSANETNYAVLSGDLIKSQKLSIEQLIEARDVIGATVDKFANHFPHSVIGRPEFYRGDSWEALMVQPQYALRLSLLVMADLKAKTAADTRIAVGIGPMRYVNFLKVSHSLGKAGDLSQAAIKNMKNEFNLTAAIEPRNDDVLSLMHISSHSARDWTKKEAKIASAALQTVGATANIEGWDIIATALERYEALDLHAAKAPTRHI